MLACAMSYRMKIFHYVALGLATVAQTGCDEEAPMMSTPDMVMSGCAQQAMPDTKYTGDAAGALKLAGPKVLAFQPDAKT